MIKTTYNDKVVRLKDFYELFLKRKIVFPTSYFHFRIKTRKRTIPLPRLLFKKIISNYLDIYFNDFYFQNKPMYFMLSGDLIKVRGAEIAINKKKGIFSEMKSIGWTWFNRPSLPYISNIKLIKLKGSTSRVGKLEKKYHMNNDYGLLTPMGVVHKQLLTDNKLFKNA